MMNKNISNHLRSVKDMTSSHQQTLPSIFWYRIAALIIDLELLTLLCALVCLVFADHLSAFPILSTLGGYSVFILYFGLLNSRLNHGQTLGKRLLKIHVQNKQQQAPDILPAMLRAAIACAPLCLYALADMMTSPALKMIFIAVLIGITILMIGFFLVDTATHRSFHDLLSASHVSHRATLDQAHNQHLSEAPQFNTTPSTAPKNIATIRYVAVLAALLLSYIAAYIWLKPTLIQQPLPKQGWSEIQTHLPQIYQIQAYRTPIDKNTIQQDFGYPADQIADSIDYRVQVKTQSNLRSSFLLQDFTQQLQHLRAEELQHNSIEYEFYTRFQFGPIIQHQALYFQSKWEDGELKLAAY